MTISASTQRLLREGPQVIPEASWTLSQDRARDQYFTNDRMLAVKQEVHNNFRTNPTSYVEYLYDALDFGRDVSLLDLGCGNAFIMQRLVEMAGGHGDLWGLDIAPGILDQAKERFRDAGIACQWFAQSAEDLTFLGDNSIDRAMANFMMHYVADINACLAEVARTLRHTGRFVLTTDSHYSMYQMFAVHFEAVRALGLPDDYIRATPKHRISYDTATEQLARHFDNVVCVPQEDELRFTDSEPFMRFYMYGHNFCALATAPDEPVGQDVLDAIAEEVRARVQNTIDRSGAFLVTKLAGLFVATGPARR